MKASYTWIKDHLDFDLDIDKTSELLTELGLEVEGQESYCAVEGKLNGCIVGEVLTKEKHPNADRLSVTTVDIGGETPLHIVCGAPNVDTGQKVIVATVGTTLYPEKGDPFKIKKSKVRGEVSEGMICAEDELGIGNDHDGILVLSNDTKIGTPAIDCFDIFNDTVYEIGLTPNRSDGGSHIGIARDLYAALKFRGQPAQLKTSPAGQTIANKQSGFSLDIKDNIACPRYSGVMLENLNVGESPSFIKDRLEAIGIRSINNVVDITNFILHEYGQPLHAFDLNHVGGNGIIVQTLPQDSAFITLDGEHRKLDSEDLMICDGNGKPMCIAGVFGGLNSGVTEQTTSIFLESAHFDPKTIRRTSMRHNLRTEAAKVYEKGSDPNVTVNALNRAVELLVKYADARVSSQQYDIYPQPVEKKVISVRYQRINDLTGAHLTSEEIEHILTCLHMDIVSKDDELIQVAVPTDKSDVLREVDVVEEILRVYGFNNIEVPQHLKFSLVHSEGYATEEFNNVLTNRLAGMGLHQMMNLSLSSSNYYAKNDDLVYVMNSSNSHLDVLRPDLLMSAIQTVQHNVNRQQKNLALFEIGKHYHAEGDDYKEIELVSLVVTGSQQDAYWNAAEQPFDIFYLKSLLEALIPNWPNQLDTEIIQDNFFDFGMTYGSENNSRIKFGKVASKLAQDHDIDQDVFYAEIDKKWLEKLYRKSNNHVTAISKFPTIKRDLALVMKKDVSYQVISQVLKKYGGKSLKSFHVFDLYENEDHLGVGMKSVAISLAFNDIKGTLKDKQIDKVVKVLLLKFKEELNIILR